MGGDPKKVPSGTSSFYDNSIGRQRRPSGVTQSESADQNAQTGSRVHLQSDFRQRHLGCHQVTAHQEFVVERDFSDECSGLAKQLTTPQTQRAQRGGFVGEDLEEW